MQKAGKSVPRSVAAHRMPGSNECASIACREAFLLISSTRGAKPPLKFAFTQPAKMHNISQRLSTYGD